MSAKRRKYKFNAIDYLWYMGKDSWRVPLSMWPSPSVAFAINRVFGISLSVGAFFIFLSPQYGESIFVTFWILGVIAYFSVESYLKKHRFTPLHEKAYFRRYPERKNTSMWLLILIPLIVSALTVIIFASSFIFLLKLIG